MALRIGERGAWIITVAVVAWIAHPALWDSPRDSFPLSSYTMFAESRGRTASLPRAVLQTPDAPAQVLPPEAFGTDNVMQTVSLLWRAVGGGPAAAMELCVAIIGKTETAVKLDRTI